MRWVRAVWEEILGALYPPRCAACALVGCDGWCEQCADSIPYITPPVCARCGTPVDAEGFCLSCSAHPLVPEAVRAVTRYDGVVRTAIHRFKYGKHPSLAPALARLLLEGWQTPLTERLHTADVVLPVPIHRERERERGFNQSALLAELFCQKTGLPMLHDVLERTVYRQPQVGLDAVQRQQNVQNAFQVRQPAALTGRSILLIDDVWTTGSTLNEAARTLLAAGAARVFAYTVAHERLEGTDPTMR